MGDGGLDMAVKSVDVGNWNEEVIRVEDLVLVEFYHEMCPWCKRMEPIYDELAVQYGKLLKFVKMNVLESEENKALAVKYGLMGTPTLMFFCQGKPIATSTGFVNKDKLSASIDDMLTNYRDCIEQRTDINYI